MRRILFFPRMFYVLLSGVPHFARAVRDKALTIGNDNTIDDIFGSARDNALADAAGSREAARHGTQRADPARRNIPHVEAPGNAAIGHVQHGIPRDRIARVIRLAVPVPMFFSVIITV